MVPTAFKNPMQNTSAANIRQNVSEALEALLFKAHVLQAVRR